MIQLTPIDTAYKGHLFRSRLEARWAVFFNAMGLYYEYEPEGFVLGDGTRYLPDFKVSTPQGEDMWIEVKPASAVAKLDPKFREFKNALQGTRAYQVNGDPLEFLEAHTVCPRCGLPQPSWSGGTTEIDCTLCDWETPSGGDHPLHNDGLAPYRPHKGMIIQSLDEFRAFRRTLEIAATKARRARFEHGAKG